MRIVYNAARLAVLALAAASCGFGDITDPGTENPIQVTIDFCSNETPIWFAHQNSTGSFEVLTPDAGGAFTLTATNRTTIAFVQQNGADYKTSIVFTSNLDLQLISGLSCLEEGGTKQVNGTVTGLSGAQLGLVGMSFSSVYLTVGQTSFTLTQLVDRPLDLMASRIDVTGNEQHANKTVIRRTLNPVSGATLTPIDFASEGVTPITNTANLSGVGSDAAFLMNNFFSQLETSHALSFIDGVSDGSNPFVTIPSGTLATGDYHDLFVVSTSSSGGGVRGVERFFRNPANQTLTLGPPLLEPQITLLGTSPTVRARVQVLGQADYSTTVVFDLHQQTAFASKDMSMTVTASYFGGTPNEWNLPMPNFDGLTGWQNSWGLQSPGNIDWTVTAYYGRPQLLFGAKPNDPETVQFASRSSSFSLAQLSRTGSGFPRHRIFSRLR